MHHKCTCVCIDWNMAEELLLSPTSVTAAPSQVESRSGTRPHLVVPAGQFKCDDDCLNFKAVLSYCGSSLSQFINWHDRVLLFTACLKVVARRVAEHLEKESNNKVLQIGLID